jgi:LPS-assembly protein
MTTRRRLIITALLVCHLVLLSPLVTSQLQPAPTSSGMAKAPGEEVTIKARQQEKNGDVYSLHGEAEIDFRNYIFRADDITYNADTGEITATGHVLFEGGPHDEHLTASHGTYNQKTGDGRFYDVVGTTGAKLQGRTVVLTSSNPFAFRGAIVDKVGRDKIIVHHGSVTSCQLPKPKWEFDAGRVVVVAGQDAKIYHSDFRLMGIPVFYFPYATHPVESIGRHSGFLLPNIGQSTSKGTILGDSFYWAIDRSMDTTLGAEYFSSRGWAQHGGFRARPNESSFINFSYFGVIDRGTGEFDPADPANAGLRLEDCNVVPATGQTLCREDQGGQDAKLNAEAALPYGFRGVANVDYLSAFVFRLAFAESFAQAINSEVKSIAFISRMQDGLGLNLMGSRYQNFQSANRGDVITIVHAPSFESSSVERKLEKSPFFWSYDSSVDGLSRREPNFVTANLVGRVDLYPHLSLPIVWHGMSSRPELSVRDTFYSDRLIPLANGFGVPANTSINRHALEGSFELRPPALSKIFDRPLLNHKFKHVIEPRVVYRYVTGIDNFQNILRFDETDIMSDTNEVEYALVNRLYTKRVNGNCEAAADADKSKCESGPSREIVSWEVAQEYFIDPTFGGALIDGRRNVFTSTVEFTGIAFLTEPRRFSPVISRLRVKAAANADIDWQLDYDPKEGRINASTALASYRFYKDFYIGGAHAFLQAPGEVVTTTSIAGPTKFNQYRILAQYGAPNRRGFNMAGSVGFDAYLNSVQYSAFQTTYNWDCCGFTFELRRFALGSVRNENQFRFALTLANVGTFGTMRKQERLF